MPHTAPHSNVLELGCDPGDMTQLLAPYFKSLTMVDGSTVFPQKAQSRGISHADFIQSLFEEFESTTTCEHIFLSYALKHAPPSRPAAQSMYPGGPMLKPFANLQMNAIFAGGILGARQLEDQYQLRLECPDLAGSLFSICCAAS